jgi:hypothetical protein
MNKLILMSTKVCNFSATIPRSPKWPESTLRQSPNYTTHSLSLSHIFDSISSVDNNPTKNKENLSLIFVCLFMTLLHMTISRCRRWGLHLLLALAHVYVTYINSIAHLTINSYIVVVIIVIKWRKMENSAAFFHRLLLSIIQILSRTFLSVFIWVFIDSQR